MALQRNLISILPTFSQYRWLVGIGLVVAFTIIIISPVPAVGPQVSVGYNYYSVSGETAQQLRKQMSQFGPQDSQGRRFDGWTKWNIRWTYRWYDSGDRCKITSSQVKVDIRFTMPRWQPAANASLSLVQHWQRYLAALQLHENGHKDNGLKAAQEIDQILAQLPTAASCSALEVKANQSAQQIVKRYNQADIAYDQQTSHGRTQGAVFP